MIRYELTSSFSISRLLVGLWQVADMEKDGRMLDREEAAGLLRRTVEPAQHRVRHEIEGGVERVAGMHTGRRRPSLMCAAHYPRENRQFKRSFGGEGEVSH